MGLNNLEESSRYPKENIMMIKAFVIALKQFAPMNASYVDLMYL